MTRRNIQRKFSIRLEHIQQRLTTHRRVSSGKQMEAMGKQVCSRSHTMGLTYGRIIPHIIRSR